MLRKGVKLLIKKMVDYKKALVAILENTLENVNAGNTNITEEEASVIIDHLTMLNKGVATVSKAMLVNMFFILHLINLIILLEKVLFLTVVNVWDLMNLVGFLKI